MFFILLGILVIILLYRAIYRSLYYWEDKGIRQVKSVPFIGNFVWAILQRIPFAESSVLYYNALPNEKCVGIMAFTKPTLVIRDKNLIKQIGIKDFDNFTDHQKSFFKEGFDRLFDRNLFSLDGQPWRDMRATLSPAFTGAKMRGMFHIINECGEQMAEFYLSEIKKLGGESKHIELELKDSFSRFTNDVIATSAFGVKCDSFKNKHNEFYLNGRIATQFKTWRIVLVNFIPTIMRMLKVATIPVSVCDYFRNIVKETTTIRKRENIVRPDMLHLLMEAQKSTLKHENHAEDNKEIAAVNESTNAHGKAKLLDDEDVAAQAFIFFLAGFETVSTLMSFVGYELALNPDIQQRCYDEIQEIVESNDGKLSYDSIQKIKFLDMVISETLRKWPPAIFTDRVCTKPYILNVNGKGVLLEKGTNIQIPIYAIHHDPNYYPNPEKFDPDRFSEENKHNIDPMTYLPFGVGPRNCIGSRFALMEVKVAMFHLIKNFEIILTSKSTVPPRLSTSTSALVIDGGFNIGLKSRTML